jgi:Flp pilus assembly protein TadD
MRRGRVQARGGFLIRGLVLAALVAAVFLPVARFDFVNFDDDVYITENQTVRQGLTGAGARWAFTATDLGNYPLAWLSHMADVTLFGLNPHGHHAVSLLLHGANTLLLFVVLTRMTGAVGRSFVVAALFGVHPLHVEPVAWVAERKELLATFFWMLSTGIYLAYVRRRPGRLPRGAWYAALLLSFSLGMSAKPLLATLPFVLLLLDLWPLGRWSPGAGAPGPAGPVPVRVLLLEKAPLLLVAVAGTLFTFVEQESGGAFSPTPGLMFFTVKVANALTSYTAYLGKALWPTGLSVFYPHPLGRQPAWMPFTALAALVVVSALAVRGARRFPALTVGWFWYVGSLVPVIGLVQLGEQGMADRYTYVPLIGIFVAACWSTGQWWGRGRRLALARGIGVSLLVVALAGAARRQTGFWENSTTLFTHALAVTADNHVAHVNLGAALAKEGRTGEAESQFQQALRLRPLQAEALLGIGTIHARTNRPAQAVEEFRQVVALQPGNLRARYNLGTALAQLGRSGDALEQFREILRLDPRHAAAHNNLGIVYFGQGNLDAAEEHFRAALSLEPGNEYARANLETVIARRTPPRAGR